MKRLRKWVGGLLFAISALLGGSEIIHKSAEAMFFDVLSAQGATIEQVVYQYSNMLSPVYVQQMDSFVQNIAQSLGIAHVEKIVEKDGTRYRADLVMGKQVLLQFRIISLPIDSVHVRPYLSIRVTGKGLSDHEAKEVRSFLEQKIESLGLIPNITVIVEGSLKGNHTNLTDQVATALRQLGGREVEAMYAERTVSISGYSYRLSGSLITRGGAMNVQVAARQNERTNRLQITLGSPIITTEY
jgi:hypothetical protein